MAKLETFLLLLLLIHSAYSLMYSRRGAAGLLTKWSDRFKDGPRMPGASPKAMGSQLLNMRHMMSNAKSLWRHRKQNQCQMQYVVLYYEPPTTRIFDSCKPILIRTTGCKGACSSYSRVNPYNPTNLLHSCSCCQQLSSQTFHVTMPCERGGHIRIPVELARECSCRPCYSSDSRDVLRVRDLLTDKKSPFAIG